MRKGIRLTVCIGVASLLLAGGARAEDVNIAGGGTAVQSSTLSANYPAERAIDGNLGNFTHTLGTDDAAWWKVNLGKDFAIKRIVLHNRDSCCGSRLRDITVTILNADESQTLFTSVLLNPENVLGGGVVNVGPEFIEVDLLAAPPDGNGGAVTGQVVQVSRTPDPDRSGSGGEGGMPDEANVLSLGEVEIFVDGATLPPTIVQQPASVSASTGQFVSLSVTATGLGPITYQWKKDGVDVAGETATKLCFDAVAVADAGTYTVVATNANGSTTSNSAVLTVSPPNVALGGIATQSSTCYGMPAGNGNDGNLGNFTHTCADDPEPNPWWEVDLLADATIEEIVLHNRDSCCQLRLQDITVRILDEARAELFVSDLLNPGNVLNGPEFLQLVLDPPLEGARIVRVDRTPIAGGTNDDARVLALGEVQVFGISSAPVPRFDPNAARCADASQSTTNASYVAGLAIDGNLANFTHTLGTDAGAWWQLDLVAPTEMHMIVIENRRSCCFSRLRDIRVTISDDTKAVLFESDLLNPGNVLGNATLDVGPATLIVDLVAETGGPITGTTVRITREPDPELIGTGGQGNPDEANVLSMAEVLILGPCPDQRDAHCAGLTVEGPPDNAPGDYTITASGVDETGDRLTYDFFVDGPEPKDPAPQVGNAVAYRLGIGTWDVSVKVDDSTRCPDDAADAVCSEQIVVVGDPKNLAPRGVAGQSSTGYGGIAYRAIDGITDGVYNNGSMSHTAVDDPSPWWEVDLLDAFTIERIVLWNRTDCCGDRLQNYRVSVLDGAGAEVWGADFHTEAQGWGYPDPSEEILPPAATAGQVVRIATLGPNQGGTNFVSLAEVQVFGCPAEGDTHCEGLSLSGPAGDAEGTWTVTANAVDDSGDDILYSFAATDGTTTLTDGPKAENTAQFDLTAGQWAISVTVDDDPDCEDVADDAECTETLKVCPSAGDTHCQGLVITGPDGTTREGTFTVEVSAVDDSGDDILYSFTATDGTTTLTDGPKAENTAQFDLTPGQWTITVTVDDDPDCGDAAGDGVCTEVIEVLPQGMPFVRGDTNASGVVDISDAICILDSLFGPIDGPCRTLVPQCMDAADTNDDGTVDVADPVYLLTYLFISGPVPPVPFPDCGRDDTEDEDGVDLGCDQFEPCGEM